MGRGSIAKVLAIAGLAGLAAAAPAAADAGAGQAVVQSSSPAATPAARVAPTPPAAPVEFDVALQPEEAGAASFAQAVSDPRSASYGHFLTPSEWEARFSPPQSAVDTVSAWLRSQGVTVDAVTPDRMTIQASAPAATVERAFSTHLGQYRHGAATVRLAAEPLKLPASIAPLVTAIGGVDQVPARPAGIVDSPAHRAGGGATAPGFNVGHPCSTYWGQRIDTTDPPFGAGYPYPLPYNPCGYNPTQLEGGYGVAPLIAGGIDGKGVRVAIVDALASPTLFADAHEYSERNQPGHVLAPGQFSELLDKPFEVSEQCVAEEEWSGEQHLDVEAVHAMAPGARILYVGAKTCTIAALESAVQQVVDGHLAQIVTDSWGNGGGDLFEAEASRKAFDHVLQMAIGTGIGVQFSSGDEGDEYTIFGTDVGGYPNSSPYATSVGGTSLMVGKAAARVGEFGWSTSKSVLCTPELELAGLPGCTSGRLEKWLPPAPGAFDYGGGGGTSYSYPEPSYQLAVVPAALAERNSSITGERNRVQPDISMDGDPSTGMTVGEQQEFPGGVRYNEDRVGGTSLSSPLFAGVMALADQAAGKPLGFVNPALYQLDSLPQTAEGAFFDVVPGGKQAMNRVDYLNGINAAGGVERQVRTIEYEGQEQFCDGAGSCRRQRVILGTAPGFDSMTGIGTPQGGLVSELAGL